MISNNKQTIIDIYVNLSRLSEYMKTKLSWAPSKKKLSWVID